MDKTTATSEIKICISTFTFGTAAGDVANSQTQKCFTHCLLHFLLPEIYLCVKSQSCINAMQINIIYSCMFL